MVYMMLDPEPERGRRDGLERDRREVDRGELDRCEWVDDEDEDEEDEEDEGYAETGSEEETESDGVRQPELELVSTLLISGSVERTTGCRPRPGELVLSMGMGGVVGINMDGVVDRGVGVSVGVGVSFGIAGSGVRLRDDQDDAMLSRCRAVVLSCGASC